MDLYLKYLETYYGKALLKKHKLDETGEWKVVGEDPNCDLGGRHHNPYIGVVKGTLNEAIKWSVDQNKFWSWGTGGIITKINVLNLHEKYYNDKNELAVIINVSYGSSFDLSMDMRSDPKLVKLILKNSLSENRKFKEILKQKYNHDIDRFDYFKVEFIPKGIEFIILDHQGAEYIIRKDQQEWITA